MNSKDWRYLPYLYGFLPYQPCSVLQVRQSGQSAHVLAVPSLLMQQTLIVHLAMLMSLSPDS